MRLIDADELKKYLNDCKVCNFCPDKGLNCCYGCDFPDYCNDMWERVIDEQPTVEEEKRKVGKWIRGSSWSEGCGMGETYGYYYKCSECGEVVKNDYDKCSYNFCPNCKAIMKGTEK